jgi:hypothetical protein
MAATAWKSEYAVRARRFWRAYQQQHDVSALHGQIAAVDPESGRVWIGESAIDALDRMNSDGVDTPVWFVRVGYDYYVTKGRR